MTASHAMRMLGGAGRALLSMRAEDIERIELVRDAAASIYGFRGSNGAILVSTRRR